jgi:hypothetical protein
MHPDLIEQYGYRNLSSPLQRLARTHSGPNHAENVRSRSSLSLRTPAAGGSLETVIAEQMAWITGRIDRYARGSMLKTPFYQRAKNTDALPAARKAKKFVMKNRRRCSGLARTR